MVRSKFIQIQKRDGRLVEFDQSKITTAITKALTATNQGDGRKAQKLSDKVVTLLNRRFKKDEIPKVEEIQDIVEEVLILEGYTETAKAYILYREQRRRIREAVRVAEEAVDRIDQYLEKLDWEVQENANMAFSLQGLNHYGVTYIVKKYWLNKIYPKEIREANESGDLHIHNLDTLGCYCEGWDLYDLLLKGFGGVPGKMESKPAKHFRAALGQIVNFLFSLQGECAGAVAFSNFDTLLAPFIRYDNLNYQQVKQALQEFLFNMATPTRVGFQCVSEDTEILTPDGWQGYNEVKEGDEIKTLNLETKEIETKKVKFVFKREYQGKMYRLRNRIQDQLISPEHRIVRRKFYSDKYVLEPIEEVRKLKSPFIIPIAGQNPNPEVEISDEQIKLMAWTISEGSVERPGKHRCCYRVSIYQSKVKNRENYNEIIGLLKNFNLSYANHPATALGEEVQQIRLNAESSRKIHQWFGTRENVHFIPEQLLNLSQRQSRLFLETFLRGDGTKEWKIATGNLDLLSDLQIIIINSGYGFTVLKRKPTDIGKKDIYILRIIRHPETYITKIKKVNYEGIIWCPHTENGTIIARRKGKVFITGNCPFSNITLDLRPSPVFAKQPVIIGAQPQKETYQEFEEEMKIFDKALYETILEGDKTGRPFHFPIPTINITKDFPWDEPAFDLIFEASAKYGTNYFCLTSDTLITKKGQGSQPIKELKEGDFILTENGYRKVKKIFKLKADKIVKITLKDGTKIKTTPNHRFPLETGELQEAASLGINDRILTYQPKEVTLASGIKLSPKDEENIKFFIWRGDSLEEKVFDKIREKDVILIKPESKFKNIVNLPKFRLSPSPFANNIKPIRIPQELSLELSRFIGYMIGDGSYYGNGRKIPRMSFVNADEDVLRDFLRIIRRLFGDSFAINTRTVGKNKKAKMLSWDSTVLRKFLLFLGLGYVKGKEKEIPSIFFETTKENIQNLLRGLFETDGTITPKGDVFLTLKSEKVIYGTQRLLLKLGIFSKTKYRSPKEGYQLQILGRYAKKFVDLIGFINKNKKARYKKVTFRRPCLGDYRGLAESILEVLEMIKEDGKRLEGELQYIYEKAKYRSRGKITPDDLKIMIQKVDKKISQNLIFQNLKFILDNELFCDTVIANHPAQISSEEIKQIKIIEGDFEVFDLSIDSPTHLFVIEEKFLTHNSNYINSSMDPSDVRSMCCRLKLDLTELYNRGGGGLFGSGSLTGSIGVVTINLPRIGYLSKTKRDFFERLARAMDLAKESLEIKRKTIENFIEKGLYPYSKFYLSGVKKMRNRYYANHFSTIGLVGLNEALLNFLGEDIASKRGRKFTLEVMDFMREKLVKYQEETGNFYNLEATPAESTAYRLALKDKAKYPDIITAGTKKVAYYTNSSQLPVNYTDDIFKALKLQDEIQCKYTGGTVEHLFLGERISDITTVKSLIRKIFEKFHLPYITLTPTFSICPSHGYLSGEHHFCPKCTIKQPCEVYSRVVGYYRPLAQYNIGKQQEFRERKTFKVPK